MRTVCGKSLRNVCLGSLMAIFFMGSVWAQPGNGGSMSDREGQEHNKKRFAEISEKLNLTKEQQAKIDANREQTRKEFDAQREQIVAKQKELSTALEAATLDMNNVTKIHNEFKALTAKREDQRLAAILQVRQILTPEQFSQFMKMAAERKEVVHEGFEKKWAGKDKKNKPGK